MDFYEFIGSSWVILFAHPEDYTPVCTTELAALGKYEPEFTKRGVKLVGLSANTVESHGGWIHDIDEIAGVKLSFPIIGDKDRKIAFAYDMYTPPSIPTLHLPVYPTKAPGADIHS
jgi:glutaredoxin/glutathione-dependent peroxiredoxin